MLTKTIFHTNFYSGCGEAVTSYVGILTEQSALSTLNVVHVVAILALIGGIGVVEG